MPLRFTNRIIEHLAYQGYRPTLAKAIAKDLRVDSDERDLFQTAIEEAHTKGLIEIGGDGCIRLPVLPDEIVGKYRSNKRGFGFVKPSQRYREGDVYIAAGAECDAVTGDIVRVHISRGGKWKNKGSSGRIIDVVERAKHEFVGSLMKQGKTWLVKPDGRELHNPIIIRDITAKNAKAGDKVVFEIVHFPEQDYYGEGVITRVLGVAGKPDVETMAVILAYGLHEQFNEETLQEARNAASVFDETPDADREDLTSMFIFTIDPPDAKDFDDAIQITFDKTSQIWELGVHIADVASFVTDGSSLDRSAIERGNSVYLPRHVIPMLPEVLSNGVCSLQEGVRRWAKSVFIQFDQKGSVQGHRLSNSVICSSHRLTYLEAQALIDGNEKEARIQSVAGGAYPTELIEALRLANELGKKLLARRRRNNMIELQLPEVVLEFDNEGRVKDAHPEDDAFTHRIIEMFMVEANEAVARIFAGLDVPLLRRTHPEPKFGDMEELRLFARSVGVSMPEEPTREDLQRLLQATQGSDAARAVHFAVLKTLTQATYSPAEIGHFALASDHYAHFTSPIRRYPDLAVHRVIDAFLDHSDNGKSMKGGKARKAFIQRVRDDDRSLDENRLIELGEHCSSTERNAEQAERSLRTFLVMQFLSEHHLGDEFVGIVTGFSPSGFYVSLERFLVEGLARFDLMRSSSKNMDRWEKIEGTSTFIASRSGAMLTIGDKVKVQITAIDLASREMELLMTSMPTSQEKPVGMRKTSRSKDKNLRMKRTGKRRKRK